MAHELLKRIRVAVLGVVLAGAAQVATSAESIVLASTTSTEQSGLFGHILPIFEKTTGISVKVVALGTGQALDVGRRGDADALLVHDRAAEDKFVAEGYGSYRRDVMYNDFVVVGPTADPAAVRASSDTSDAFRRIAGKAATFISRADKSGTHAAELRFWKAAAIEPQRSLLRSYLAKAFLDEAAPLASDIDFERLARLDVAGGSIPVAGHAACDFR